MKKLLLLLTISLILSACEKEESKNIEICKETSQRIVITTERWNNMYSYIGCKNFEYETIEIKAIDAGILYVQYGDTFNVIEFKEGQKISF